MALTEGIEIEGELWLWLCCSCPVTPRSTSKWYWTQDTSASSDLFVAQTEFVPAFQLYSSNVVYLHCNLHLCLIGDDSCQLKTEASISRSHDSIKLTSIVVSRKCTRQPLRLYIDRKSAIYRTAQLQTTLNEVISAFSNPPKTFAYAD